MFIPPSIPFPYSVSPRIFSMTGDMGKSHIIYKYLKFRPKAFSTWVYTTIMLNPPPPILLSLFLHLLLSPITEVSSPLFIPSVVDHILSDIHKLMSSPMYTPARINPSTPDCNSLNNSWKTSSKSWILSLSPTYLCKNQPYNCTYSSTNNSNHLPTQFLNYISDSVMSSNGNTCHFYLLPPLNSPFNYTMMCERYLFFLVSYDNFSITFRHVRDWYRD